MTILDFTTGACTRKRVGSCQALVPLSDGSVLVASGKQGTLSKCAPASGVVTKITSPGPFVQAAVSESASLVVVVPCDPAISAESWLYHDGIGHGLSLVQLNGWGRPRSVAAPSAFDGLWLSADGRRLILSHGSSVMLCEIDDLSVNLISRHELPSDVRAVLVIPELGLVLAADDRPDRGTLSAWQLSG